MFRRCEKIVVCGAFLGWLLGAGASWAAGEGLRDPTQPFGYVKRASAEQALVLQAIFYGGGRREAIVNGKSLKEGDTLGAHTITRIERNQVLYRSGGQTKVLRLRPSIFKNQ